jgi:opacity protein-like surface antigen
MDYTMKKFLFLLTALCALSANQAGADEGLYAGVFGGANWLDVSSSRVKSNFEVGYVVGGSVGYRWCGGLRLEGEIAYRNNDIKSAHVKNRGSYSCSDSYKVRLKGHVDTVSYMANVLYDWPFECSPMKVYFGAGIGGANQKFSVHNRRGSSSSDCAEFANDDYSDCSSSSSRRRHSKNSNGFAAQAIVGVAYNICDCYDLTAEYRYLYVNNDRSSNNNALVVGASTSF